MAGFTLIKIFCDTNILHASQAHLLLPKKVSSYISEHQKIESVELKWLIPKMVIDERRHQMIQAAKSLTPKIIELEKLLGHALGMNEEVMTDRVETKIRKTISNLGLEICDINCDQVNWKEIIKRSATRQPPFEFSTEKEKGFRDSIIATTFLQELDGSPSTPRSCLLVFVSGDGRLREYLLEKTKLSKNVRILESLDDLKSLLNAIASEITEEFLSELSPKAKRIFYDFNKKDGLYNKADVIGQITDQYSDKIIDVLEGYPGCRRESDGVTLGDQTFIRKKGQTIVWTREVILKFKVVSGGLGTDYSRLTAKSVSLLDVDMSEPVTLTTGMSEFSVEWQHQISTKGNIMKPKINKVEFLGHTLPIEKY